MAIVEHDMWPGVNVRFIDDAMTRVVRCVEAYREGVIDPLLLGDIKAGTLVWVCLDNALVPGTLSHQFAVVRRTLPACGVSVLPMAVMTVGIPVEELTDLPTPASPPVEVPESIDPPPPIDDWGDDGDEDEKDCNVRPPCV
jgi:hypothetical protein